MQPRQFNMLALSALISLIAAGVVHSSYNSWTDDTLTGKRLFPRLETEGNNTGNITIQQGEKKLTFKKSSDSKLWTNVERAGYPVDPQKVRELVVKLGQTELIQRKTASEKLYGQLELGDPAAKDSTSKLVRLGDVANKTIAEVVVGKQKQAAFGSGKSGTYVRVPGDPQTWLAHLELNTSTDISDWVTAAFFKFDDKKMKSLVVKEGDKAIYSIGREKPKKDEKQGAFKLVDLPAGRTMKKDLRINDLIKGISTLELINVRAANIDDKKPDMTADITMDDGAKYRVGMKRDDKKRWMTVAVIANGKDEAASKKIASDTNGWAYEIADWRADQSFKKLDDIYDAAKAEKPKMSIAPKKGVAVTPGKQPEPADADVTKK